MVEFGSLNVGDLFVYDGVLFAVANKIVPIAAPAVTKNAFNFQTSGMAAFSNGNRVLPVDGELVWKRKK